MKNQALSSAWLAWRDWKFEFLLSLCSVLALASMLAPILILQGLANGVIDGMRERLLEDPAILIITPKSDGGRFSEQFISELTKLPGAAYAVARTRDTATDLTLLNPATGASASIALEPATAGEPVLTRANLPVPANKNEPELVLSATASRALGAQRGAILEARLGRRSPQGRLESQTMKFHVSGILPVEAADRKMAFAPLALLEQLEDYRDFIAVPERGYEGDKREGERQYASFRLYARNLEAVETLAAELEAQRIETSTRAREIAGIRLLENAINQVILIIAIAVGAGFTAFAISSVQSAVARKRKMLGMLRLLGFRRLPMILYPLTQTMLTAIAGLVLSLLIYEGVALVIARAFAAQGALSCSLGWQNLAITIGSVLGLSILACSRAAWTAQAVEPSIVIRDV